MSIEILLIPIAIAAAGAIKARRENRQGERVLSVATRARDEALLRRALDNYGCRNVLHDGRIEATSDGRTLMFAPSEDGAFEAVFFGDVDEEMARQFVDDLEHEYGRVVQADTYSRLVHEATNYGFSLEAEEIDADNTIVLTLKVN
jgi:hypothetical protein